VKVIPETRRAHLIKYLRFYYTETQKFDRKCNFCGNGIGGEFRILFFCENEIVVILRNKYIPNYYRIHPSYVKLVGLLSICNSQLYK
jgi:hypothetical protein